MNEINADDLRRYFSLLNGAGRIALKSANFDLDGLERLFVRGDDFQAYVVAGISRFSSKLPDYTLARSILGADFISPEEVAKARPGIVYTEEQIIDLGKRLPDQATLEFLRDYGMTLMASPPTPMCMLDIRTLNPDYFYTKGPEQDDSDWYDAAIEKFARTDKVEKLCWVAIRKEPVVGSLSETWLNQQAFVNLSLYVPNAAEVTWGITTYKAVRDIYLLKGLYVRTSSIDSDGDRVSVGDFDHRMGMVIFGLWNDESCDEQLGVSACRKF